MREFEVVMCMNEIKGRKWREKKLSNVCVDGNDVVVFLCEVVRSS